MNYFIRCFAFGFIFLTLFTVFSNAQVLVTGTLSGNNYNVKIGGNYSGTNYPGHSFTFLALSSNTGASTLSINGGAPAALVKNISQPIVAGDIKANQAVPVIFDGINFQIIYSTTNSQWISTVTGGSSSIYYTGTYVGLNMPPQLGATIIAKSSGDFDDVLRLYRPDGLFQVFRVRDNVTGGIVTAFDGSNNSRAQISADIGVPSYVLQLGIGTTNPIASLDVIGNARITGPVTVSSFAVGPSVAILGVNSLGGIVTFSGANINNYWTISGSNLTPVTNVNIALVSTNGVFLIGTNAGLRMNDNNSIYIGNNTGTVSNTPANNVVIGKNAGSIMNTGGSNVLIGLGAGQNVNNGFYNNMIGQGAGGANGTGSKNNFIGIASGFNNVGGTENNFIGANAGLGNSGGNFNIAIGSNSNFLLPNLTNAIAIGQQASVGGSNMMVLGGVKGSGYELNVGLGTSSPSATLDVNGNARFTGPVTISEFATGGSVYALGVNSLGGILTIAGGIVSGSQGGTSTGIAFWANGSTLTSNPAFYWNNTTSILGIGGTQIKSSNLAADNNFFVGQATGGVNTFGVYNNFLGLNAGASNTLGSSNNFLGAGAGQLNINGSNNNFLGFYSGANNLSGTDNVFLGEHSGFNNTNGSFNIALGYYADVALSTLTNGIAIGYKATVGGSNMIALGGTGVNSVKVGIGTVLPSASLDVNGNARFLGPVTISGFDLGNSVYALGVNSLGGIVTVSGTTVATGFSGYTSSDVTLGISTTQISFDGENYDKASALSGSVYVVPVAGEYIFNVSATTNNIGEVDLLLLKNGSVVKEVRISPAANTGVYNTVQLTAFLDLNVNDSISVIIRQYTQMPQTLFSLSGTGTTFSGKKLY